MKCQVCEQNTALLYCQGCGVLLCAECCYLDLFGHGCDVVIYICAINALMIRL